ncbi:MAG TPA: TlpA disulfide reductase family protein [Burkholderiales bacterium]|nr:TlpA disulfide reductase family protein [Burkholderiales bacterium]
MRTPLKLAAAALAVLLAAPAASPLMKPGQKFAPFALKGVDGKEYVVTLEGGRLTVLVTETVDGKPRTVRSHPAAVLIDFWATWCIPCREGMPTMEKLHQKYRPGPDQSEGGLRLLSVAMDNPGSKKVKILYDLSKVTYPMLYDPTESSPSDGLLHSPLEMKAPYDAVSLPVVYLIDATGTIVHVHQGFKVQEAAGFEEAVKRALAGAKA